MAYGSFVVQRDLTFTVRRDDIFIIKSCLNETLDDSSNLIADARKLLSNLDLQIAPLTGSLINTLEAARVAFPQAEETLAMKEVVHGELVSGVQATLSEVQTTLVQGRKMVTTLDNTMVHNTNMNYDIANTLAEITDAARSPRILAEYLEQNPDAILRGKGVPER